MIGTNSDPETRIRAVQSRSALTIQLGPLNELPGVWIGTGFSLIARPHFGQDGEGFFYLQLDLLQEFIEFASIGSPVFNRGSLQGDISIFGVTYMHRVTNLLTGGALHVEPGMWLNIPATTAPKADASIARLATIPHGNAICATGTAAPLVFDGIPEIPPANTTPFPVDGKPPAPGEDNPFPQYNLSAPTELRSPSLPSQITQALVNDPNLHGRDILRRQVNEQGKKLNWIKRLSVSTDGGAPVANIPFIVENALAPGLSSDFLIESVTDASGAEFLQLQYSQTTLLKFRGYCFPHVTVGTLVKSF